MGFHAAMLPESVALCELRFASSESGQRLGTGGAAAPGQAGGRTGSLSTTGEAGGRAGA
ncbi:MAG: hypothetical protein ACK52I_15540 [Pseudomonadota bacterium]